MKKVLIITYYWPPSGGAGVQRWLKFVKYLRDFGWEPIVYTAENPEAPANDESLLKDIPPHLALLKTKIWEPYSLYKSFIGQKRGEKINAGFLSEKKKPGIAEKISIWIRGNFFIPDARKYWIVPSIKFLTKYIQNNPIDVIISTGPPHSMHMIALGLKKKLNLPWLADFRDPWTNIDFYDKLMLTKSSDAKHKQMETEVLRSANSIVAVGWTMAEEFQKIANRKIEVIPNGYDEADFHQSIQVGYSYQLNTTATLEGFTISHIGAMNADRNHKMFWLAIKELISEDESFKKDIKIHLIGKTDISVKEEINKLHLSPFVIQTEYLPHSKITKAMQASQVLLLALNNTPNTRGVISGKLFEYIASKRPILAIGKENGDASKILYAVNAGVICDFTDKMKMKEEIKKMYLLYKNKELKSNTSDISSYSRRNQTKVLSEHLNFIFQEANNSK